MLLFSLTSRRFSSSISQARLSRIIPSIDRITGEDLYKGIPFKKYFLDRTSKGNLPIYKTYRSQAVYTDVRKIRGDIVQLRNDLQAALPDVPKKNFTCVMSSKTIKIKGDVASRLKELLNNEL